MITLAKFILGTLFIFSAIGTGDVATTSLWLVAGLSAVGLVLMAWAANDIETPYN
tara:strand:+ start:8105 stop:8269 length:165 start_codon:yes stop_codon:yes gene_type:complete